MIKSLMVLCAAIHYDDGLVYPHQIVKTGRVYAGHRHHRIFCLLPDKFERSKCIQGFLLSDGNFVDRKEAMKIAKLAGQTNSTAERLFSEDLY